MGLLVVGFNVVWKSSAFCFLVFLFFVFMSCLDFIVHGVLYGYGLRFSYDWAVFYWWIFGGVFLVFSVVVGFAYWLGSGKSGRDVKVGFGLSLTVCLLFSGGLADVLWFLFWRGGLPNDDVVWWWMPGFRVLGFWNSSVQLFLLSVAIVAVMLFWIWIFNS